MRFFQLRHHQRTVQGQLLDLGDIFRSPHEGNSDPIYARVEPGFKVSPVLSGDRRHRDFGVRQTDALAVRYLSRDIDDGDGAGRAGLDDMKPHLAIGNEDGVAWLHGA